MGEYGSHSDEVAPTCLKIGHVRAARTQMSRLRQDRHGRKWWHWGSRRRNYRSHPRTTSVVRRWCIARPARPPHPLSRWQRRHIPPVPPNQLRWNRIVRQVRRRRGSRRPPPGRARACAEGCRAVPAGTPPRTAQPAARPGQWSRWRRSTPAQFKRDARPVMPRAAPVGSAEAGWAGVAVPEPPAPAKAVRWGPRARAPPEQA